MGTDRRQARGRISGEPRAHFITPGSGEAKLARFHISQAVRIGNVVEISGQSGADAAGNFAVDLRDQITQALRNVEDVLRHAGAQWTDVFSVTSYHVVEDPSSPSIDVASLEVMAEFFRHEIPDHPPLWTAVPVPTLAHPGMRVEIVARASV